MFSYVESFIRDAFCRVRMSRRRKWHKWKTTTREGGRKKTIEQARERRRPLAFVVLRVQTHADDSRQGAAGGKFREGGQCRHDIHAIVPRERPNKTRLPFRDEKEWKINVYTFPWVGTLESCKKKHLVT